MALSSLLRLPRPKAFLWSMSLRTGTELITTTLIINKATGLYGILAIFTGFHLSPFQLSMYIYSILALILAIYLAPHIRKQTPFQCLALAWFYVLDSAINGLYTAAFAMTWFVVITERNAAAPGGETMKDTGGFSQPVYDVDHVDVHAGGFHIGQNATNDGEGSAQSNKHISGAMLQSGSIASLSVIVALWALRVYFMLIILSYARLVIRHHIMVNSWQPSGQYSSTSGDSDNLAENPFAEGKEAGLGWKGKLGRVMLSLGKRYWLGADDDSAWMESLVSGNEQSGRMPGTMEREARRRTGTGPPAVSTHLKQEMQTWRT